MSFALHWHALIPASVTGHIPGCWNCLNIFLLSSLSYCLVEFASLEWCSYLIDQIGKHGHGGGSRGLTCRPLSQEQNPDAEDAERRKVSCYILSLGHVLRRPLGLREVQKLWLETSLKIDPVTFEILNTTCNFRNSVVAWIQFGGIIVVVFGKPLPLDLLVL